MERCITSETCGGNEPYWEGVRQALGWALGEYDIAPQEDEDL